MVWEEKDRYGRKKIWPFLIVDLTSLHLPGAFPSPRHRTPKPSRKWAKPPGFIINAYPGFFNWWELRRN
jgi:hypothetical protein